MGGCESLAPLFWESLAEKFGNPWVRVYSGADSWSGKNSGTESRTAGELCVDLQVGANSGADSGVRAGSDADSG